MRFYLRIQLLCLILLLGPEILPAQPGSDDAEVGPASGSLIIIGGGVTTSEILFRFRDLAGGFDAPIVFVPTANVPETIDTAAMRQSWLNSGFRDVTVLHTTDPAVANSEAFVAPLRRARGVFFGGGRQWRYVDAYWNTLTLEEFHNVLARGGVIAGSSAGASIQASFLARGAEMNNTLMIAPEEHHRHGFGFIRNCAIDQHVDTRDRWTDMYEIIESFPHLLGFGISESTALVVQGDCAEVIGRGQVAVHDSLRLFGCADEPCYSLLNPGDYFDLKSRQPGACTPTSVAEFGDDSPAIIFPNPSTGPVSVVDRENLRRPATLRVMNVYGALLIERELAQLAGAAIDLSALSAGVYLISVEAGPTRFVDKVIKR